MGSGQNPHEKGMSGSLSMLYACQINNLDSILRLGITFGDNNTFSVSTRMGRKPNQKGITSGTSKLAKRARVIGNSGHSIERSQETLPMLPIAECGGRGSLISGTLNVPSKKFRSLIARLLCLPGCRGKMESFQVLLLPMLKIVRLWSSQRSERIRYFFFCARS